MTYNEITQILKSMVIILDDREKDTPLLHQRLLLRLRCVRLFLHPQCHFHSVRPAASGLAGQPELPGHPVSHGLCRAGRFAGVGGGLRGAAAPPCQKAGRGGTQGRLSGPAQFILPEKSGVPGRVHRFLVYFRRALPLESILYKTPNRMDKIPKSRGDSLCYLEIF